MNKEIFSISITRYSSDEDKIYFIPISLIPKHIYRRRVERVLRRVIKVSML